MRAISIVKKNSNIVAAGVLAVVVLVAALNAGAIHRQLNDWKLLPQPERLTELYFVNHAKLPTTYLPGIPQQFSFVTHNLEYRDTTYGYAVIQESQDGKQSQPLTSGSFSLRQNASHTTPITFTPADLGPRVRIITTLENKTSHTKETIHYWVTSLSQGGA